MENLCMRVFVSEVKKCPAETKIKMVSKHGEMRPRLGPEIRTDYIDSREERLIQI